jgi:hypothetical protein
MICYDPHTLDRLYDCGDVLQHLVIIRGLPGSGKNTKARQMLSQDAISADDYFMHDGLYLFDPKKLGAAHAYCQKAVADALAEGEDVAVANTFTQRWEIEPYIKIARGADCVLGIVDLFDGGLTDSELARRNLHGVPEAAIAAMRARYEHNWLAGNPRAPWER